MDLNFSDWVEKIKNELGKEEWLTVYLHERNEFEQTTFFCALIPNNEVRKSLKDFSWDLHIGGGLPGTSFYYGNGKKGWEYCRFLGRFLTEGVEPLIFSRNFLGLKEEYLEISEEFRHYFNLCEDKGNNKYIFIDDNGDDEEVVLISKDKIQIKLKFIKEFLSVKKMHLAIFFDFMRFSDKTIDELGIKEYNNNVKGDDYVYSIGAQNAQNWGYDNIKSQGWLMGKKSIPGLKNFKPKLFNKNYSKFVDFIIGVDEEGKEIISNSFGKNKGSPNYLTPITFRKDVLTKYYSQPDKYTIGDGYLSCAYLWRLPIDNNHLDYVMVFLGDLGKLSYKEQLHWRSFNVATKGKISYTSWARNFENKFTEPEKSDLFFKQKYRSFQVKWEKKFGWKLFRQLSKEDHHHFKALHVPLTNQQKEFDEQISSLTKILIESLNERELEKRSRIDKKDAKGIDKLEAFLATNNIRCKEMIEFLRDLQKLRSAGAAHLKGRKYERVKQAFSIGEKDLSKVFDDIITKCIWTLNALESYFLRDCRESLTEV